MHQVPAPAVISLLGERRKGAQGWRENLLVVRKPSLWIEENTREDSGWEKKC